MLVLPQLAHPTNCTPTWLHSSVVRWWWAADRAVTFWRGGSENVLACYMFPFLCIDERKTKTPPTRLARPAGQLLALRQNKRVDGSESKCLRNITFTRPWCIKILAAVLHLLFADKTLSYTHNLSIHAWPPMAEGRDFLEGFNVRAAQSCYRWFELVTSFFFFFLLHYLQSWWFILLAGLSNLIRLLLLEEWCDIYGPNCTEKTFPATLPPEMLTSREGSMEFNSNSDHLRAATRTRMCKMRKDSSTL